MSGAGPQPPEEKPVKDAATVIVLREASADIETFMVRRHTKSGFMGGAHVFPGGKVDAEDKQETWSSRIDEPAEDMAGRLGEANAALSRGLFVAAVRETFEEAGVLLASVEDATGLSEARDELNANGSFDGIAARIGMHVTADALTPYARWITPDFESRRFDTRFFIAALPDGQEATHDGTETTSAVWLRPAAVLDGMRNREIMLAPPTVRTLEWLSDFDQISGVVADARSRKPPLVRPTVVPADKGWFLALPGDPAHAESDAVLPGTTRMVMDNGVWRDAPADVR